MSDCDETIRAILEQPDNGLNPISQIFPQTNLSTDNQSEQRSSLERVSSRIGFNVPPLETESIMSPLAASRSQTNVPSPLIAISPEFSSSAQLQSPKMFSNSFSQYPIANDGPPEMVGSSGGDYVTPMIFNNDVPHQPMNFDHMPHHEGFYDSPAEESVYVPSHESHVDFIGAPLATTFESDEVAAETDIMNIISLDSEDEEYKEDENVDEKDDSVDELPPRKRRKYEVSDMFGAKRTRKEERVILRMECEEDNPDDGYQWRKYGRKIVNGNPNPRSYFKCTYGGCNVKKHVERGADDVKLLVTTYDGKHNHPIPTGRSSNRSGPRNRSGFSASQPPRLRKLPSSSSACQYCYASLEPHPDMTQLYMTGLSKLPSFPVNHNHGFMYGNDEQNIDRVIPDGAEVYNGIKDRLFPNFGYNF
ncbi:probable WRKY transcription factor 10 [Raphanus sativus]|uniref:Probable WRKY transcription factor 10 n=1 Tax=Raphanus sativus TaxID=3726 RepID=A0A6J0KRG8_RAPSA|nr:probable WRKY transcription factor 10 [Raphanus sativus]